MVQVTYNRGKSRRSEYEQKIASELRRQASIANRRLDRLEASDFTNSPAFSKWVENGSVRFSVGGKDLNELQTELARVLEFNNAKTSTVKGARQVLSDMQAITGVSLENIQDKFKAMNQFFKLSSKVEQYLESTERSAGDMGYRKIFEIVNTAVERNKVDLEASEDSIESIIGNIADELEGLYQEKANDILGDTFDAFS